MHTSFQMQYFGRGAARVPMPRAVAREVRKDWVIHPSYIILVLAVAISISFKISLSNKNLFKDTKTIILLPEAQPVPEPSIKEEIPLIKVLQDAVKKTIEPKKIELKKITPAKAKPNRIIPKNVVSKKIKPLKLNNHKVQPKKVELNLLKPKKPVYKQLDIKKITPKKIPTAPRAPTTAPLNKVNPKPEFHAMIPMAHSNISTPHVKNNQRVQTFSSMPVPKGPVPQLAQRQKYRALTPQKASSVSRPASATLTPTLMPVANIQPANGYNTLDTISLIIQGASIGNSGRVKSLKNDIRNKALNMSENKSPYQYMVKGYKCTVIIKGKTNKKVNIKFLPADAPFKVVSALERLLPR